MTRRSSTREPAPFRSLRAELQASLKLVREWMLPYADIHPEMITHTRVIDLKTGRPIDFGCRDKDRQ